MDTIIQPSFTVGALQGPFQNGVITNAALGAHAEMLASQLDPPYRAGVRNSETFFIANQAATTYTAALTAIYTGCMVANPTTSKKMLSILKVSFSLWAAPAGIVSVGLIGGWLGSNIVTVTAALTVYGSKTLAAVVPNGAGYAGATLTGTPIWITMLGSSNTSGVLPTAGSPTWYDIGGLIEVPPGGWVAIGSQTGSSSVGSIHWREVDP